MKARFSREALGDLDEIFSWIAARNPVAASELAVKIDEMTRLIGHYPRMGKRTKRSEFRSVTVGNYLIVYKIHQDEVLIRYVRHGARQRVWEEDT
jgi:toxin ParE1/3/4